MSGIGIGDEEVVRGMGGGEDCWKRGLIHLHNIKLHVYTIRIQFMYSLERGVRHLSIKSRLRFKTTLATPLHQKQLVTEFQNTTFRSLLFVESKFDGLYYVSHFCHC